jgi:hypothetical protein
MKRENNEQYETNLITLPLMKVGARINLKDKAAISRWLAERDISVHKQSAKSVVYKIDFDLHFEKPFVLGLKRKHPQKWKEMYRAVCTDDRLYNLMMISMDAEVAPLPTTKVSLISNEDKKIFKDLS